MVTFNSKESTCSPLFQTGSFPPLQTLVFSGVQVGLSESSSAVLVGRAWETDVRLQLGWAKEDCPRDGGLPKAVRLGLWNMSALT